MLDSQPQHPSALPVHSSVSTVQVSFLSVAKAAGGARSRPLIVFVLASVSKHCACGSILILEQEERSEKSSRAVCFKQPILQQQVQKHTCLVARVYRDSWLGQHGGQLPVYNNPFWHLTYPVRLQERGHIFVTCCQHNTLEASTMDKSSTRVESVNTGTPRSSNLPNCDE